jgi:hypothetical protein
METWFARKLEATSWWPITCRQFVLHRLMKCPIFSLAWYWKVMLCTGEKVYVHCVSGSGRAAVFGACLLASAYGVSADEALQRVQMAREQCGDEGMAALSEEQMQFVRDFCEKCK